MANDRIDARVVIVGELAKGFQDYLNEHWPEQKVIADIMRRALGEYLQREGYLPRKTERGI